MTTHFITAEINLNESTTDLTADAQNAIADELAKQGDPLRWAVTAVNSDEQTATVEAVVTRSVPSEGTPQVTRKDG